MGAWTWLRARGSRSDRAEVGSCGVLPRERSAIGDGRRLRVRARGFSGGLVGSSVSVCVQFCADRARLCGVVEVEQAFFMHDGA
jgi:hypothetical protein